MKHLTIMNYGSFLGVVKGRILIKEEDSKREIPFSRVRSVTITREGISCSSAFLIKCALHGIRVFFLSRRHRLVVALSGSSQQAVVELRKQQFRYIESDDSMKIMRSVVQAKVRNQRAVLLYFSKYTSKTDPEQSKSIEQTAFELMKLSKKTKTVEAQSKEILRNSLMGYEGRSAVLYWQALRDSNLMADSFTHRTGRGAQDSTNQGLNLGYAILQTYVWNALLNAGLEIYAGFLHADRPGKPSLVLDIMETYRPWVVDRTIIKLRQRLGDVDELKPDISKDIVAGIHKTFAKRYYLKGKKLKLETILQRQVYRLAGEFCGKKSFKPYLFKW